VGIGVAQVIGIKPTDKSFFSIFLTGSAAIVLAVSSGKERSYYRRGAGPPSGLHRSACRLRLALRISSVKGIGQRAEE